MSSLLLSLTAVAGFVPQAEPNAAATAPPTAPWRILQTFQVGGDGPWDYLNIDSNARRLYVPLGTQVMVLDADTGAKVGDIAETAGVRDVVLATALGRGFTSNGKADTTTVFDLAKGTPIATLQTGKRPSSLVYDAVKQRVYIANLRGESMTVVAADRLEVIGTVALGGKPEGLVVDADGRVFVNLEDTSEVAGIDPTKLAVDQRFKVAPGKGPAGLAIDPEHHRLFSICHNRQMVVLDSKSGAVLATPAIGKRGYSVAFDADRGDVLTANSDGTLTVIATKGDKPFTVVQTLTTAPGASTLVLDPKTHRVYLPTAAFEAASAAAGIGGGDSRRQAPKPGSFKILVAGV